ncbi:hypothetical protein ON058_03670 [Demequina sp. B12]|uniref:hypothetical protein n=1 Tax=Demequina sp. B12 TaxID=2992757 RepID=UPI00237B847B|nr:hypothetical protein [Demequina sp. B12]MDE0572508.1 hypothetical protein [Demequina sp. B12]
MGGAVSVAMALGGCTPAPTSPEPYGLAGPIEASAAPLPGGAESAILAQGLGSEAYEVSDPTAGQVVETDTQVAVAHEGTIAERWPTCDDMRTLLSPGALRWLEPDNGEGRYSDTGYSRTLSCSWLVQTPEDLEGAAPLSSGGAIAVLLDVSADPMTWIDVEGLEGAIAEPRLAEMGGFILSTLEDLGDPIGTVGPTVHVGAVSLGCSVNGVTVLDEAESSPFTGHWCLDTALRVSTDLAERGLAHYLPAD